MNDRKNLLAYCGFYCGDCLGYTGVIAAAATDFKLVLEKYQFKQTAQSIFPEQLKDYDHFFEILGFITGLKCPMTCRERPNSSVACPVRQCCIEHGFVTCADCNDFEECEQLKSLMEGLHYEASLKNLKAIKTMGLENWLNAGKRHHYWDVPEHESGLKG